MIRSGPARTFTREAVNAWLLKLAADEWEPRFDHTTLDYGRELYREGAITAIELSPDQAIVSRKIDRKDTYSVIEWTNGVPDIRSSTTDPRLGPAIAIAGLYEIEELLGEEHVRLPIDEERDEPTPTEKDIESAETPPPEVPEPAAKKNAHQLVIVLEASPSAGLTALPTWKRGRTSFPVYGPKAKDDLEHIDRETLLHFVASAGKTDFTFEKCSGLFRLRNWKSVAEFAEKTLPEWEKRFRIRLKGDTDLLRKGRRNLSWEIDARHAANGAMTLRETFHLGTLRLNATQSRRIVRARSDTLFVPGQGLVRLDPTQADDFDWWRRNRASEKARAHWPRYMLFSFFARKYLKPREDGKLAVWREAVKAESQTSGRLELPSLLRPYQRQGVSRIRALHTLGCHPLLADEMGLGKTIQTLALLNATETSSENRPDLVVCPAAVVPVWIRETQERFPHFNLRTLGKNSTFDQQPEKPADTNTPTLWLASYTQLRRHRSLLDKIDFRYAILDEAQLIKNPKAKVTQACLAIQANHRLALSGTPIENTPLDLWTIFRFLMPGLLGSRNELEKNLKDEPTETADLLRRQVAPFVIRRIKADVAAELPPKLETDLPCPLTEEQRREYRILAEGARAEHGDDLRQAIGRAPTHVFSLLTRLRQACCDSALLPWNQGALPSGGKTELLLEKLSDLLASSSKAIIFSQFTSYLTLLKKLIIQRHPSVPLYELTGSIRDRATPVQAFEKARGSSLMLASLKAGGLGITLRSADYVFLMDPWWNPAAEEQAIDRAHRLGREKPTFVYRLVATGTVEERVRALQRDKREAFRRIIGQLEPNSALADHFSSLRDLIDLKGE